MKSITTREMYKIDAEATSKYGIPSVVLMENAGRTAAEAIINYINTHKECKNKPVGIVCGGGNNGGDGFVVARHLYNHGIKPRVILLKEESGYKNDALTNLNILKKLDIKPVFLPIGRLSAFKSLLSSSGLIVDAIFGIGVKGEITGLHKQVIDCINSARRPVISIDIPSGLDADTGRISGACITADITVTMHAVKKGMISPTGKCTCGKILVANIGIPQ